MSDKIPTAEEFIKQYITWSVQDSPYTMTTVIDKEDCLEVMKKFAELHVKNALQAVAENVEVVDSWDSGLAGSAASVNKDSIINAYPLINIK